MSTGAIFLSASVPDPARSERFASSADVVAITSSVNALVQVVLGRRRLVWGGHPAITPMIRLVAGAMDVDYCAWVHLFQSRYFEGQFPKDVEYFRNVTVTEIAGDREASLLAMRKEMFSSTEFEAAVFIGGMAGIVDEFELFRAAQPKAKLIPIYSTGGATLELTERVKTESDELLNDLDYIALLHRQLSIPPQERRYKSPTNQPSVPRERLRRPGSRSPEGKA